VTFLADGAIGQGRNKNEHTWRISKGKLEIFSSDGLIYSRFTHDKTTGFLKHTNETAMPSIQGQYLQPGFVRRSDAAQPAVPADGDALRAPRR